MAAEQGIRSTAVPEAVRVVELSRDAATAAVGTDTPDARELRGIPTPTNVPMTPLGMGTGAQPMQPMTVPAAPQMPPVGTQTTFDPWAAAAANARTQAASYGNTGTEGGRMEPPDAALWRNYQAPTTQFPDQQQQQQQQQTGAQYAPDASSGPSYGTDQRGTQADPAQTTTTGPQWRPSWIPPSNAGGLT